MRTTAVIGRLPWVLGDMPAVGHDDALLIFGGASGAENRDEILHVDGLGNVRPVGRLPSPCRGHQAVKIGNSVYLLGGFAEGTLREAYRIDLGTLESWPIAPMPRESAWFSATELDGRIFVVGGFSIPDGYWDEVATYDPAQDRWSLGNGFPAHIFPKGALGSNAIAAVGGHILSFGGADTFDTDGMRANALAVCARFDPATAQWSRLPAAIEPRESLVVVAEDGRLFLIGGMLNPPAHASDLIEAVDTATMTVTPFARMQEGRAAAGCGIVGGRLLIAGGVTEGVFAMTDAIEAVAID
ncbi:Kelch repeat-containing protein [Blastochloris viridis]|uniref:N-acetylneuraminic acid mutarotase n=1 Tax=Blastochloris viridis TaxID=1079 RepID=A0A0H5B8R0_BLAVI|nr:kelch repeat-containing protein [Blastochloris viridis]ALK08139.1 N-acetylneuraminate epimerase [Blastochloris viridis]BAR98595.1 hypothetical protein BV133_1002 [Blastochloris viridis]CUU44061.1 N-acetylneuraminic acid mutarotase [Blastochloris viridis]